MTDAELEGLGMQALNILKHRIETGGRPWLLASYHVGEPMRPLLTVEALIEERLGEDWMNHGGKKDAAFRVLRIATGMLPPDAMVIGMAANMFQPTERLWALPRAEAMAILNAGHDRHHRAVAEGLMEVHDGLTCIAQTPERVCICSQRVEGRQFVNRPDVQLFAQAHFDGRLKFFGTGTMQ